MGKAHTGIAFFHKQCQIDQNTCVIAIPWLSRVDRAACYESNVTCTKMQRRVVDADRDLTASDVQNFMLGMPVNVHAVADMLGRDLIDRNG